ncbi:ATP-binding cassette domain-containing protein, partial [Candidatus Omnitrophota bacterium]
MKIIIENLSKVFKDKTHALTNVNLVIEKGIFGLVGPNASGKTTLIRILATLLKPTGGRVTFDGMDLQKNRAAIRSMTGYLPQKFSAFAKMTTWEFLDYSARLAGLHDKTTREHSMDELLDTLGLYEVRNRLANELSPAMKRHLEIAQAVIG